jgi:hypothetical protein
MLFLLFAALWAQFSFFNLAIFPKAAGACQALLVFTTMFDQLARVGVEQFLMWAMGQGTKATTQQMILQGILVIRLITGGLVVAFTRPDFAPVCSARNSLLPTSIVVLTLDVIIVGVFLIRASSLGMFGEMGNKKLGTRREQSRALIFTIAGFTMWAGVGFEMAESQLLLIFLADKRPNASGNPNGHLDSQNCVTCDRASHTCG